MSASNPKKHLVDMLTVAEVLGTHAGREELASPVQKALAREVGFALAAAHYYAVRMDCGDLAPAAPVKRVFSAGVRWARYFPLKALINYGRLLMLVAFCPRVAPTVK